MRNDFFQIYDALAGGVGEGTVRYTALGPRWALAESERGAGLALATAGDSRPALFPGGLEGLPLRLAAEAAGSWNLSEAGLGLAALNAWYNTPERVEALGAYLPFERYYTEGLDLRGRTVGIVGHMHGPKELRQQAKEVYILERDPKPGDFPDTACDWLLPRCDLVLITGSSLVNKTLPHLLELCGEAYVVLTGPSVPLCPALLELGVDRLAGLAVTDRAGLRSHVERGAHGHPYGFGLPFVLSR